MAVPSGYDVSVSLQKDFARTRPGVTATYEDKAPTNESELFVFIAVAF